MKILNSQQALATLVASVLATQEQTITDQEELRADVIDTLITTAVFSSDEHVQQTARKTIRTIAKLTRCYPASIFPVYDALGKDKLALAFTVPALNIRTLTYDTARIVFRLMNTHSMGPVIFEIARSEIGYTNQRPDEYAVAVLAAAIKEGYHGPVFLQGDHFQLSKRAFGEDKEKEIKKIEDLTKESIDAEFFNIDIDASTLVDLTKPTIEKQQQTNAQVTAHMTAFIREHEPNNTTISIGAEIGHIGGKNSTTEDFIAFMNLYNKLLGNTIGIRKMSVQTGTSHGGMPRADGTIADVALDFSVLQTIGTIARKKYHLGGAVQHGASTLPEELFDQFPATKTLEIHLATGFQNIVYETMPKKLRNEIYHWLEENCKDEWEEGWTKEQFLYKTRKKALGPFKEKLWLLSDKDKAPILKKLEERFLLLFTKLNIADKHNVLSYATRNDSH